MPGSGKSVLGPKLAARLQVPFFDLDACIEEQEESPVPELFRQHGESWFRHTEAATLRSLPINKNGAVVATGGGTPCFLDNMQFMNKAPGVTVYLQEPVEVLVERLTKHDLKKRPLLAGKNKGELKTFLQDLLKQRQKFYQKAGIIVGPKAGEKDKLRNLVNALSSFP